MARANKLKSYVLNNMIDRATTPLRDIIAGNRNLANAMAASRTAFDKARLVVNALADKDAMKLDRRNTTDIVEALAAKLGVVQRLSEPLIQASLAIDKRIETLPQSYTRMASGMKTSRESATAYHTINISLPSGSVTQDVARAVRTEIERLERDRAAHYRSRLSDSDV